MQMPVQIRAATQPDIHFVLNSYIKSLLNQKPWSNIDTNWGSCATALLATKVFEKCSILIACDPTDHDQIFGWVAGDPAKRILVWIYTKNAFRNTGVGTSLMKSLFTDMGPHGPSIRVCHRTASLEWQMKRWGLIYDSHPLVEMIKD